MMKYGMKFKFHCPLDVHYCVCLGHAQLSFVNEGRMVSSKGGQNKPAKHFTEENDFKIFS